MSMDLLDTLLSDMKHLRQILTDTIDDHELRRCSVLLRRLLVDNNIQLAWIECQFKKQPNIKANSLCSVIEMAGKKKIKMAYEGDAIFRFKTTSGHRMPSGIGINVHIISSEYDENENRHLEKYKRTSEEISLSLFMGEPCIIDFGLPISRRHLVKFVANKLGGAHYDKGERRAREDIALDTLLNKSIVDKSIIFYELLSIGHQFVHSADICKLIAKIEKKC